MHLRHHDLPRQRAAPSARGEERAATRRVGGLKSEVELERQVRRQLGQHPAQPCPRQGSNV
eukprot:scaffold87124_cov46-Phaeocystis_antarctica.AAC.1